MRSVFYAYLCPVVVFLQASCSTASELCITQNATQTQLALCGNDAFHSTHAVVTDARVVGIPGSSILLVLWNQASPGAEAIPYYAVSYDGTEVPRTRRTSYELRLKYESFDPLQKTPIVDALLGADGSNELYVVQFVTQPLAAFRSALSTLGAKVYSFIPNHAHVVRMSDAVKAQVEALPYVRVVSPWHRAYRLEPYLRNNLDRAGELFPLQRCNIMVFERGLAQKSVVADRIREIGGTVDIVPRGG